MIDEKIIMGVRNKNADAKKELISLTKDHLIRTIYKRYIGLEEKEINDILQATYTYAFMNMDKWIIVLLNKQLREYMQAKENTGVTTALRGLPQYRQSDVDDCLNEMPENQKAVTIMHCLGRLKEKDIANRLKMSEEGVARLLKSGKQKVKDVLEKK